MAIIDNRVIQKDEYDFDKTIDYKDDGDVLNDPSMNDFLKGYQIEPYEFKQWAKVKGYKLKKQAGNAEVYLMQFTPEFLGDRILTLWNSSDGQLQRFFEGFTQFYNNNLKMQIAAYLDTQGYKVYPQLIDDKPIYAKTKTIFKKVIASRNLDNILAYSTEAFKKCEAFMLFAGEVADLIETGHDVTLEDASGLLSYYKQIYPEDYAISLVSDMIENPKNAEDQFKFKEDYCISDEALNQIENYMRGDSKSYTRDGGNGGYDFVTDMRGTDGTRPTLYEASKKKR